MDIGGLSELRRPLRQPLLLPLALTQAPRPPQACHTRLGSNPKLAWTQPAARGRAASAAFKSLFKLQFQVEFQVNFKSNFKRRRQKTIEKPSKTRSEPDPRPVDSLPPATAGHVGSATAAVGGLLGIAARSSYYLSQVLHVKSCRICKEHQITGDLRGVMDLEMVPEVVYVTDICTWPDTLLLSTLSPAIGSLVQVVHSFAPETKSPQSL